MNRPVLLDVTRAVLRCWQGGAPSGIDRVGEAYIRHFGDSARAVVQMRGVPLTLGEGASRALFGAMRLPRTEFRRHLWRAMPAALARPRGCSGSIYLNVTHTDFDLPAHRGWVQRTGVRPVYLLHDLIPLTHPEVTTPRKVARHRGRVHHALDHASAILVNSQATAVDLADYARLGQAELPPVLTAPLGIEIAPAAGTGVAVGRAYFVSLGTIEKRKNQLLLLRAWQRLIDQMGEAAPMLVLAGHYGAGSGEVRAVLAGDARLRQHVVIRNGLSDADVHRLLSDAQALLFPSRAEGFGLPVAEALGMGVPVIASDLPALREIGQDLPIFLDPLDAAAWARMVARYCQYAPARHWQIAQISEFRAPAWADHFAAVDAFLPTIARAGELANSRNSPKLRSHPAPPQLEPVC